MQQENHRRTRIAGGNMPDSLARKWFPFLGALFLFLWWSNIIGYLPLPTNSGEKFNLFGAHIPSFALYAATANISVPLVLAIIVGGGLAVARLIGIDPDDWDAVFGTFHRARGSGRSERGGRRRSWRWTRRCLRRWRGGRAESRG